MSNAIHDVVFFFKTPDLQSDISWKAGHMAMNRFFVDEEIAQELSGVFHYKIEAKGNRKSILVNLYSLHRGSRRFERQLSLLGLNSKLIILETTKTSMQREKSLLLGISIQKSLL